MAAAERHDPVSALERKIRHLIEQTVDGVRRQFEAQLEQQSEGLRRLTEGLRVELPGQVLSAEDLAGLVTDSAETRRGALGELLEGVRALDGARSQAEILDALIEAAGRFCSRTALFLVRPGEIRGWGGNGFEEADQALLDLSLAPEEGRAWERISEGRGWIHLDAQDCGLLCSRLEAALPGQGILVPLVLRDRVAAALYADRLGDDERFEVESLLVLTHLASLSLETLALRERVATPSLWPHGEGPENLEALPVWEPAATPAAPPARAPEPEPSETPQPVPAEEGASEQAGANAAGPGAAAAEPPAPLPPETEKDEHAANYWQLEDTGPAPDLDDTRDQRLVEVDDAEEPPRGEPPAAEPAAELEARARSREAAEPDETRPGGLSAPPEPLPEEEDEEEGAAPAAPAAETPAPPPSGATTEVSPPPDMEEGPGRAVARLEDGSAAHEEARRLARLLVSEIKLYNEEDVQEGRRKGDLYQRLKEDIDRSRALYEERIEPSVRSSADYFRDELVRILADGNEGALGMSGVE